MKAGVALFLAEVLAASGTAAGKTRRGLGDMLLVVHAAAVVPNIGLGAGPIGALIGPEVTNVIRHDAPKMGTPAFATTLCFQKSRSLSYNGTTFVPPTTVSVGGGIWKPARSA